MKRREDHGSTLTLRTAEYVRGLSAAEAIPRPAGLFGARARSLETSSIFSNLDPLVEGPESSMGAGVLPGATASAMDLIRSRVHTVLRDGSMATAFQPIYDLATGHVAGAEALTRFDSGRDPDVWFAQAATAGLAVDAELAAVEAALSAAVQLPDLLYVSVNASPVTCLSPRFSRLLRKAPVRADRIVLELTEHSPVEDYTSLLNALAPLRSSGMRVAVDDAGAGHSSMLHILRLAPDIIKLDKELITDIDTNHLQKALGRAMVNFACDIGATITAEGIETAAELATVTKLGMTSGQGYFLGHPTLLPDQWAQWHSHPGSTMPMVAVSN
ncbi:EAL domain-containing protein [Arthrobacter rhizosphaerae]|uniref:EAL domain-containing protein n=1 Tax=Arthrobacter rhizosphaerae TaxID=2855490 RepID=UPI001FF6C06D|nr:EAL domain-containing protein [Arthrobacter rhizosphaerae]